VNEMNWDTTTPRRLVFYPRGRVLVWGMDLWPERFEGDMFVTPSSCDHLAVEMRPVGAMTRTEARLWRRAAWWIVGRPIDWLRQHRGLDA
jgi:hypothetical protein